LLEWARESAGMSREEAAEHMQLAPHRLYAWEEGIDRPTIKQLRSLASIYKQPFAAFFLPTAPEVFKPPVHDYRRLPDEHAAPISSDLLLEIREALDRRSICLELYADRSRTPPQFTEKADIKQDAEKVGERVRELLKIDVDAAQGWSDERSAFNAWREAIEAKGVLVFQSRKTELSAMRGYSIAEFPLPIIVVNRKDAPAGRTFTLLHELTHLLLRSSGVCDLDMRPDRTKADQRIEVFCNHVAGAALVPKRSLISHAVVRSHGNDPAWRDDELRALAKEYGVSREVVLRRILILHRTSEAFYERKRRQFQGEYERREGEKGFLPPARDAVSIAGKPFVSLVLDAFNDERITTSDVSDFLGVKLKHLDKISEILGMS
jgi:Zn-dependent peptidase ImmA (M78 family)/DNA-binding XRE family transcriptional regulator